MNAGVRGVLEPHLRNQRNACADSQILLYGSTDSGHSYTVRSFLLMSGTSHRYVWIDLTTPRPERPADFVAASKFGEVPILVDQGRALCQSNAVLMHLAQKTGQFCGSAMGTIADISCIADLFWLSQVGTFESEFQNVQRWLSSMRSLPGWVQPDEAMKWEPREYEESRQA